MVGAGTTPAVGDGVVQAPRTVVPTARASTGAVSNQWASTNWSGYTVTGSNFTKVSGTFQVPKATGAKRSKPAYSSAWIGIDGFDNGNLIQAGTASDWSGGTASYYAWWEILPASETRIPASVITVHAGDLMTVKITKGSPKWTIRITDKTTGKSFTTKQVYGGAGTSAEWIVEAPLIGNKLAKLAHYGPMFFDNGRVNGASPNLQPSDSGVMTKGAKMKVISSPSVPDDDAKPDGFAMRYGPVAPPPPSS